MADYIYLLESRLSQASRKHYRQYGRSPAVRFCGKAPPRRDGPLLQRPAVYGRGRRRTIRPGKVRVPATAPIKIPSTTTNDLVDAGIGHADMAAIRR